MFIRTSRVKRNGKTYEYRQLVRSYRRDDGRPAHEIICSLKDWSELEIENLKRALTAARNDERVVVGGQLTDALDGVKIVDNLDYLDVAVLDRIWKQWQLDTMCGDLVDDQDWAVSFADCVESLVIQRCVAAGSKLYATRWFPESALPELLAVDPEQFNNSRIHRVLDQLDAVEDELKARLPVRLAHQDGHFGALFLDVTDTWFEGQGPQMASRAKTKEGMIRKKVGIVLMCNERGYPVAWETIAGNVADDPAMLSLLGDVKGAAWLRQVPVVVDRAMGATKTLTALDQLGIRFVSALRKNEFPTYTDEIPTEKFDDVDVDVDDTQVLKQVCQIADETKMTRLDDGTYLLDLGRITKGDCEQTARIPVRVDSDNPAATYLAQAEQINDGLAAGMWASLKEAAAHFGHTKGWASQRSGLRRIAEDIRQDLEGQNAPKLTLNQLVELSRLDVHEQRSRYHELKTQGQERAIPRQISSAKAPPPSTVPTCDEEALYVHGVLIFSPQLFVDQRRRAFEELGRLYSFAARLNTRAETEARLTAEKLRRKIDQRLRRKGLVDAFQVDIYQAGDGTPQVALKLEGSKWHRRRRYDGFSLLVAHRDLALTGEQIHRLYRQKHIVETDFRTMKSVVELRPVYHRDDAKIRAHVTLCVLALLLERTLSQRLTALAMTGEAALERLRTCRLNRLELASEPHIPAYTVTEPTPEQTAILDQLELPELVDDRFVQEAISGR